MNPLANRLLSTFLAVCISAGGLWAASMTVSVAQPEDFTDLPAMPWYDSYLGRAIDLGLFTGTSATTFSPERGMARAEAVTVLVRIHESLTKEKIHPTKASGFSDIPLESYYNQSVDWAAENKLVSGYGSHIFSPDKVITHAELAVMFQRYLEWTNKAGLYLPDEGAFTDQDAIPTWAKPYVQAISGFDIFQNEEFSPDAATMRGEAVALFVRLYEKAAYPVDCSTPRQKYIYHRFPREDGEGYVSLLPLGESHKKLITSLEEYTEVMESLQSAEKCQEVGQPVSLKVTSETFAETNLMAVEVQLETMPAFDCDFGGISLERNRAAVTLIGKNQYGTASTGKSILYIVPMPKTVTEVDVLQLSWTEDTDWTPM